MTIAFTIALIDIRLASELYELLKHKEDLIIEKRTLSEEEFYELLKVTGKIKIIVTGELLNKILEKLNELKLNDKIVTLEKIETSELLKEEKIVVVILKDDKLLAVELTIKEKKLFKLEKPIDVLNTLLYIVGRGYGAPQVKEFYEIALEKDEKELAKLLYVALEITLTLKISGASGTLEKVKEKVVKILKHYGYDDEKLADFIAILVTHRGIEAKHIKKWLEFLHTFLS